MDSTSNRAGSSASARRAARLATPRLTRELDTIAAMLRIYCHDHHVAAASGPQALCTQCDELLGYPALPGQGEVQLAGELAGVVVPLRLQTRFGVMSFISTTTIFGTPVDVTLQELAIETLFAADESTATLLRKLV